TVLPPRSTTLLFGPRMARTSALVPTVVSLPSVMARAWRIVNARSTVTILPLCRIMSASWAGAHELRTKRIRNALQADRAMRCRNMEWPRSACAVYWRRLASFLGSGLLRGGGQVATRGALLLVFQVALGPEGRELLDPFGLCGRQVMTLAAVSGQVVELPGR